MAYFAEIKDGVVTAVHTIGNDLMTLPDGSESEEVGVEWLSDFLGGVNGKLLQISYNTQGGVHKFGGTPRRKNYCGEGWLYHPPPIDGFSPPKPYESWALNEETCWWAPPVPMPDDAGQDKRYRWNEESGEWEEFTG